MQAYLLVEQHRAHADLFLRNAEGLWVLNPVGEADPIPLTLIELAMPMAIVYDGVAFGDPAAVSSGLPA